MPKNAHTPVLKLKNKTKQNKTKKNPKDPPDFQTKGTSKHSIFVDLMTTYIPDR